MTRSRAAAVALAACLALPSQGSAAQASYLTTLQLGTSDTGVAEPAIAWDTTLSSGMVSETDLSQLTLTLYTRATMSWQDQVIVDGAAQAIGGVSRSIAGAPFESDLTAFASDAALALEAFDHDVDTVSHGGAGEVFNG